MVGASTLEALEEAVQKYKALAKQVAPHSEQAKNIIRRLVQLRMKLFEAKVHNMSGDSKVCFTKINCTKTFYCVLLDSHIYSVSFLFRSSRLLFVSMSVCLSVICPTTDLEN